MATQTKIQWADSTVNFWSGCTKVSLGCKNCYAETRDKRHMIEKVDHWGKGAPRLKHVGAVKQALAMNRKPWICDVCGTAYQDSLLCSCESLTDIHRRRIFVNSLSDWLDKEVSIKWFVEMLYTIFRSDQVIWILCTKRPENGLTHLGKAWHFACAHASQFMDKPGFIDWLHGWINRTSVPSNIILLTSVENQEMADKRIPELLKIPAACRGLSVEPLLGPIDLTHITDKHRFPGAASFDVLNGKMIHHDDNDNWTQDCKVDWVIIGGESGPGARACNVEWIHWLVRQGKSAGVAMFVKQLGSKPDMNLPVECPKCHCISSQNPGDRCIRGCDAMMRLQKGQGLKDKKGGDPSEWPEDLRVQQFPVLKEAQ